MSHKLKPWRDVRVILISRPGREPSLAKSYRSRNLSSTMLKILERFMDELLRKVVLVHGANFKFLTCYTAEGEDFLERIVTGYESWVHYWTPNMKKTYMMRKTAGEPIVLRFKEHPPVGKIMATVSRDGYGLLLLAFQTQKMTVTSASYFYFHTPVKV